MGLDQDFWLGNVENAAASIIDEETVQYVSNIYEYRKLPSIRGARRWRRANDA
jgi:hypothetical protein